MMRALFSAISGMRNHMSFMDVVGNNIANVNTTAYKSASVSFQDILGQTIRGASSPQDGRGGTNPAQIGLGTQLAGISNNMAQGSLQSTGKLTDFAVQGDGFFVVSDGNQNMYTRDGSFDIDVAGNLVNPTTGLKVMGWIADPVTGVDTSTPTVPIKIPFGTQVSAKPTAGDGSTTPPVFGITMAGNLDSGTPIVAPGNMISSTVTAYDSLGNAHTIKLDFTKTAANTWDVTGTEPVPPPGVPATAVASQTINFLATGRVDTATASKGLINVSLPTTTGATDPLTFTIDMSTFTQFAGASQVTPQTNTGSPAGALISFAVGPSGEVSGIYSNGSTQKIGQLALASFANSGGLMRAGQNLWTTSASSGDALIGTPNANGRGSVSTGTLETSNVDLAQQFTNVIIAQRGFQSSSRVITASDQMLQDLVNIIH